MKSKKQKFEYCFPILEKNEDDFIRKVKEVSKLDGMIELRLDYLLSTGKNIYEVILLINKIESKEKKMIATIRTKTEGGNLNIGNDNYKSFIENIYLNTKVSYIDVEYEYYKKNISFFTNLFSKGDKKIIISKHVFDKTYTKQEYHSIFKRMAKLKGDICKYAINVSDKEELFTFMEAARESNDMLRVFNKKCIFIAMGEIGKLSRLWPEFTNTEIVFLTAYNEKHNSLGQLNIEKYVKFRKLLAKIVKN